MKLFFLFAFMLIAMPAHADWPFDEERVRGFCEKHQDAVPDDGFRPKEEAANKNILALEPGDYEYDNGIEATIFEGGFYVVQLPEGLFRTYGTSWFDLRSGSRIYGGCTLAQLSQLLGKNKVIPDELKPEGQ